MNKVTENNTEVELYFDKELSDITFEVDSIDEWKNICSEIGLENQLSLTKGKDSPIPFPYINESMRRVYTLLCPSIVDFKEYNKTPIPLEVLRQISFCIKENYFNEIQIWHDDKSPDPLVVGYTYQYYNNAKDENGKYINYNTKEECLADPINNNTAYKTNENKYLIAKWGDVKRSFNELKEIAKERFVEKHAAKMKTDIEALQLKLKRIEENATLYILGEITESKATTQSDW